jgi:hypothetical protein
MCWWSVFNLFKINRSVYILALLHVWSGKTWASPVAWPWWTLHLYTDTPVGMVCNVNKDTSQNLLMSQGHYTESTDVTRTLHRIYWCHKDTTQNFLMSQGHCTEFSDVTRTLHRIFWCHKDTTQNFLMSQGHCTESSDVTRTLHRIYWHHVTTLIKTKTLHSIC